MLYRLASIALVLLLSGCAAFRSYDAELYQTLDRASTGNVDAAIRLLESNNRLPDKDLLYYLELGMLQRLAQRYPESQKSWSAANQRLQTQSLIDSVSGLAGTAASFVVNDKLKTYAGHDYERVMLLTYMALNYLVQGDYDSARVAIKQTHELEAMIAEQRAKQITAVEEQARKRGASTSVRELNGYIEGIGRYEGPAGVRGIPTLGRLAGELQKGAFEGNFWRTLNTSGGVLFHYPAGQVERTVRGFQALMNGETDNWLAPIVGPPPKR